MATRSTTQFTARSGHGLKMAHNVMSLFKLPRFTTSPTAVPTRYIHTTTTQHRSTQQSMLQRHRLSKPFSAQSKTLTPTTTLAATNARHYVAPALVASTGVVVDTPSIQHQSIPSQAPLPQPQQQQQLNHTIPTPTHQIEPTPEDPSLDDVLYYIRRRIRRFMNWLTPHTYGHWKACVFDLINALSVTALCYGGFFVLAFLTIDFFDLYGAMRSTLGLIENTSIVLSTIKRLFFITTSVYAYQIIKRDLDTKIEETIRQKQQQQQQLQQQQQQHQQLQQAAAI